MPALPEPLLRSAPRPATATRSMRCAPRYNRALDDVGADALAALRGLAGARAQASPTPNTPYTVRGREVRGANYTESAEPQPDPEARGAEARRLGRDPAIPAEREPAGRLSLHRRRLSVPARRRRPDAHVRGRRRARAHQPPLPLPAPPGTRPRVCPPLSTRPRCTAKTRTCGPTSSAAPATPACPIATLDDMKKLYSGFDLCAPSTSVSDDHQRPGADDPRDVHEHRHRSARRAVPARRGPLGRRSRRRSTALPAKDASWPRYRGELPPDHDGAGLGLLGVSGRKLVELGLLTADEYAHLRAEALTRVRGTVQADILKEDQAQNTCIFSHRVRAAHDGRRAAVLHRQRRAQFLFGVDLRLPHRRGRREPDHASSRSRSPTASPSSSTTWRAA